MGKRDLRVAVRNNIAVQVINPGSVWSIWLRVCPVPLFAGRPNREPTARAKLEDFFRTSGPDLSYAIHLNL